MVIPFLYQLKSADISSPLSQFQSVLADRNGSFNLAKAINDSLDKPLTQEKLKEAFEVWGEKLNIKLQEVPVISDAPPPIKRKDRELFEEILDYTRNQTLKEAEIIRLRNATDKDFKEMDIDGLKNYILNAMAKMQDGVTPSEIVLLKKNVAKAATTLKEKFPQHSQVADDIVFSRSFGVNTYQYRFIRLL